MFQWIGMFHCSYRPHTIQVTVQGHRFHRVILSIYCWISTKFAGSQCDRSMGATKIFCFCNNTNFVDQRSPMLLINCRLCVSNHSCWHLMFLNVGFFLILYSGKNVRKKTSGKNNKCKTINVRKKQIQTQHRNHKQIEITVIIGQPPIPSTTIPYLWAMIKWHFHRYTGWSNACNFQCYPVGSQ